MLNSINCLKNILLYKFQRLLLSITPESEHKDIIDGKEGARTKAAHWFNL